MSKEITEIPTNHSCGKKMIFHWLRILEDETSPQTNYFWVICAVCNNCKTKTLLALFEQEEQPIENRDYMITNKPLNKTKIL